MSKWKISVIATLALSVALVGGGCNSDSFTKPSHSGLYFKPLFDYWVESISCAVAPSFRLPPGSDLEAVTVKSMTSDVWVHDVQRNWDTWTLTPIYCWADGYWEQEIEYCDANPWDAWCQPVQPILPYDEQSYYGAGIHPTLAPVDSTGSPVPWVCDYRNPPDPVAGPNSCNLDWTANDTVAVDSALKYLRPLAAIPDSAARAECDSLRTWLTWARGTTLFFRGANDEPKNDHASSTFGRTYAHIDPSVLDSAYHSSNSYHKKRLLFALLHEPAHWRGAKEHPGEEEAPYSADYFNRLNEDAGSNGCIDW